MIEPVPENEQSPEKNLSDDVKEFFGKGGVPLETQMDNCADAIAGLHKQKEGLLDVVDFLKKLHNRTMQQIEFFPN